MIETKTPVRQDRKTGDEEFMAKYQELDDRTLQQKPANVFTDLQMFTATLQANLTNCTSKIQDIITRLEPSGNVVAFNCNYGHKSLPGFEKYLKLHPRRRKQQKRPRKLQGDGTCFSSAFEPVVISPSKPFFMKCFTSTGETQIPGCLVPDLSDGLAVLATWVDYLNEFKAGDSGTDGAPRKIEIEWAAANLYNFKFRVKRSCPRQIVNLKGLSTYLQALATANVEAQPEDELAPPEVNLPPGTKLVIPPGLIREVKPAVEAVKISFRMIFPEFVIRINVFSSGKVNVLGSKQYGMGKTVYDFLTALFEENWDYLVRLKPRKDSEKKNAKFRFPMPPKREIVYTVTDEEVDAWLDEVYPAAEESAILAAKKCLEQSESIKHTVSDLMGKILSIVNALDSDGFVLDEVGKEDETNHQENALEHHPPRRGIPPLHRSAE